MESELLVILMYVYLMTTTIAGIVFVGMRQQVKKMQRLTKILLELRMRR